MLGQPLLPRPHPAEHSQIANGILILEDFFQKLAETFRHHPFANFGPHGDNAPGMLRRAVEIKGRFHSVMR